MPYRVQLRADTLRQLCDTRGWDVPEFAEVAERSPSSVYRLINGGQPNASFIAACAAVFGERSLPLLFRFFHDSQDVVEDLKPNPGFAPRLAQRERREQRQLGDDHAQT